ncbi:ribosome maturation factor RimM, partial [Lysinibacillus antri]
MSEQKIEVVGKLGSTYGIRGWLRLYSSTEETESIFDYQPWFLKIKGQWQPIELESWRYHNNDLIVKLKGSDDRESA